MNIHQIYNNLSKECITITDRYERKILNLSKPQLQGQQVILMFLECMASTFIGIRDQLNCNSVTLGTKTHKIAKNRLELLKDRLMNCHKSNKEYVRSVEEYNKEQQEFEQKCEYFKDYEKDVLKYYSLKSNVEYHQILRIQEVLIKKKYEELFIRKQEYQQNVY